VKRRNKKKKKYLSRRVHACSKGLLRPRFGRVPNQRYVGKGGEDVSPTPFVGKRKKLIFGLCK